MSEVKQIITHAQAKALGLRFYYSGKICPQGHQAHRYTSTHWCLECARGIAPEYTCWANMMSRCYNPKSSSYRFYGAKGVRVISGWHTYANFLRDMGKRPHPAMSIERLDPSKDYSVENTVWGTLQQQVRNRRSNVMLDVDGCGRRLHMAAAARELGIHNTTITNRVRKFGETHQESFDYYRINGIDRRGTTPRRFIRILLDAELMSIEAAADRLGVSSRAIRAAANKHYNGSRQAAIDAYRVNGVRAWRRRGAAPSRGSLRPCRAGPGVECRAYP